MRPRGSQHEFGLRFPRCLSVVESQETSTTCTAPENEPRGTYLGYLYFGATIRRRRGIITTSILPPRAPIAVCSIASLEK